MDQLARDFAEEAHFLFIYVREAHPDEFQDHPAHKSFEQKCQHAFDLRERRQTPRTILVDDLEGSVHRVYAGRPNMSWIVDHTGRVSYKADWTSAKDIRQALEETLRIRQLKRDGLYKDFYREAMSILPSDRDESGNRKPMAVDAKRQ